MKLLQLLRFSLSFFFAALCTPYAIGDSLPFYPRSIQNIVTLPYDPDRADGSPLDISLLDGGIGNELILVTSPQIPTIWYKNGQEIGRSNDGKWTISHLATSDVGIYTGAAIAANSGIGAGYMTRALSLVAGPIQRLSNISTRAHLGPSTDVVIVGFVVAGLPGKNGAVLVRTVGPDLAKFGVSSPLSDPVFEIYDGAGNLVKPPIPDPAALEISLDELTRMAGAFPVDLAKNPTRFVTLLPGAYTIHARSASRGSGDILVEVYEFP